VLVSHWEWDEAARVSVERPRAAQVAAVSRVGEPRAGQEDLWIGPLTSD
jgi:hypothetical protein